MSTSGKNFIPPSNLTFNPWQINFVAKVELYKSTWGWAPATETEWERLTSAPGSKKLRYDAAWAIVSSKSFRTEDEQELVDARKAYESGDKADPTDTSIRMFINRYIRFSALVTNTQKVAIGMIVPDETKTATTDPNASISGEELVGNVKMLKHLIHYSEVLTAGQTSRAKGDGVDQIEVWIAFTDGIVKVAPALSAFVYDGEVKRGLYTRTFNPEQEVLRCWYFARKRIKGKKITFGPPSLFWNSVIA